MKIRPLHPKKNFLKFLTLALLVIGGSVGIVLATQNVVLYNTDASSTCILTYGGFKFNVREYFTKCNDGNTKVLMCLGGLWKVPENGDCLSFGNTWRCTNGKGGSGKSAYCVNVQNRIEEIIPSTPKPYVGCAFDCVTRYECTQNGSQQPGKCANVGEVCCKF